MRWIIKKKTNILHKKKGPFYSYFYISAVQILAAVFQYGDVIYLT